MCSSDLIVVNGFKAPGVDRKFMLYDRYLQKMEDALQHSPWLVGNEISLADVAMAPYVNRLDMLSMSEMWTTRRPRLTDWFARIKARPTFYEALTRWCPDDLTHDLKTFGAQSWPEVRQILQAA